jgi:hypothetical protein
MKQPANYRLKSKLKTMSVTELVELFRDFVIEQDKAMRAYIVWDPRSSRGYRVHSAYPANY